MSKSTNRSCTLCRVMRSMAFSGAGGGLGALLALALGRNQQEIMLSALFAAAVFVFAFVPKK